MRLALFFVLLAAASYVCIWVLRKPQKRAALKEARRWVGPLLIAGLVAAGIVFFNLHSSGKVI